MSNEGQAQKIFLLGTIVLSVLIIGGIVWAILAGPSPDSGGGAVESNVSFNDDNDPAVGPGESKAIVRMFSDFQCPACRAAEPAVEYAIKKYSDKVRFVWNDFPLTGTHPNAMSAALAARCAEEQGKFWEFHSKLYANQFEWEKLSATTDVFSKYAGELGLKTDAFVSCVATKKYTNKVEDDMAEGRSNRVQATPTFFIGNRRFEGGITNAQWDQGIQALLNTP